jgi:acyl-CoA synthetase (AMP-forming)/AMP-acid ligase II
MVVGQVLEERSQQNPNNFALVSPERTPLTYSRLLTNCYRVLTDLYVEVFSGDRVAIVLPDGLEMAAGFFAVAIGAS